MVYSKGISESNVEIVVGGYSGVSDKVTIVEIYEGHIIMGVDLVAVAVLVAETASSEVSYYSA